MRELRDELEVPGHVVLHVGKSKADWIQQAREAMIKAELYGAKTPNEMRQKEKDDLRQALIALGQNIQF